MPTRIIVIGAVILLSNLNTIPDPAANAAPLIKSDWARQSLWGPGGHPGVQAEAVHFGHPGVVGRGFRGRWDGLRAEHLAARPGANGAPVGDR